METPSVLPETKTPPSPEILIASILQQVAENAYNAEEILDQTGAEPYVLAPSLANLVQQVHLDEFNARFQALAGEKGEAEEIVSPDINPDVTRQVRTFASNRDIEGFTSTVTEPNKKTELSVTYERQFVGEPIQVTLIINGITSVVTRTGEDGKKTRTTTMVVPSRANPSLVNVAYDVTLIEPTGKESLDKKINFKLMPAAEEGMMVKKPFTSSRRGIVL